MIGRWADRWGRRWLIPLGLAIAALSAALLIDHLPVLVAGLAVTLLSLGYDMTQPLLGGIITQLGGKRAGQAMGLNVFTLFVGFGLGSMLFGAAIPLGFRTALALFAAVQMISAVFALFLSVPNVLSTLAQQLRTAPRGNASTRCRFHIPASVTVPNTPKVCLVFCCYT